MAEHFRATHRTTTSLTWCGRGGAARLPPIPILGHESTDAVNARTCLMNNSTTGSWSGS
jgi:hypothetical protein